MQPVGLRRSRGGECVRITRDEVGGRLLKIFGYRAEDVTGRLELEERRET